MFYIKLQIAVQSMSLVSEVLVQTNSVKKLPESFPLVSLPKIWPWSQIKHMNRNLTLGLTISDILKYSQNKNFQFCNGRQFHNAREYQNQ